MGYRSDIVIAFVFKTKDQVEEVMAIYRMHNFVQQHDLEKLWTIHDWEDCWGLTYTADNVKWYESYEDVRGLEHMKHVVQTFAEERVDVGETDQDGKQEVLHLFPYAYRMMRLGENLDDVETDDDCNDRVLEDVLYDRMTIRREIETDF